MSGHNLNRSRKVPPYLMDTRIKINSTKLYQTFIDFEKSPKQTNLMKKRSGTSN